MRRFCLLLVLGVLWIDVDARFRTNFPNKPLAAPQKILSLRDDGVLETVFRYQMDHCYKSDKKIYFLSYQNNDLTDSFMERFPGYGSLVRKQSDRQEFFKQHPGLKGQLLVITRVVSKKDTVVLVKGYCGFGALDFRSYVYRVERKNGKWRVRSQRLLGFA